MTSLSTKGVENEFHETEERSTEGLFVEVYYKSTREENEEDEEAHKKEKQVF